VQLGACPSMRGSLPVVSQNMDGQKLGAPTWRYTGMHISLWLMKQQLAKYEDSCLLGCCAM
jgi:hypothetical protein